MVKRTKEEIDAYVAAAVAKQADGDAAKDREGNHTPTFSNSNSSGSHQVATTFTTNADNRSSFNSNVQNPHEQSGIEKFFSGIGKAVSGFFSKIFGGSDNHPDEVSNASTFKGNEFNIKLDNKVAENLIERVKANGNKSMEAVEVKAFVDGQNRVVSRQVWCAPDHSVPGEVSYKLYAFGNGGLGYHRNDGSVSSGNGLAVTAQGGTLHANGATRDRSKSTWETDQGDNFSVRLSGDLGKRTDILIHTKNTPSREINGSETAGCFTMCDKSARSFQQVSDALHSHNGRRGYDINFSKTMDRSNPLLNEDARDHRALSTAQTKGMDRLEASLGEIRAPQQYYASNDVSQGNGRISQISCFLHTHVLDPLSHIFRTDSPVTAYNHYFHQHACQHNNHTQKHNDIIYQHLIAPVATLQVAFADNSENVLYVARPCQYVEDKKCEKKYWTSAIYSAKAIDSISEVLDEYTDHQVELIGYSGGATIAMFLAAERDDIKSLRTIAGNIATEAFVKLHNISPYWGSRGTDEVIAKLHNIPQHHYIGSDDKIVPKTIYDSYASKLPHQRCVGFTIVNNADHVNNWDNIWPNVVMDDIKCDEEQQQNPR